MLTKSNIALSLALVLASASAAFVAPKHSVRHQASIARQIPAGVYLSLARAVGPEPSYMKIQDQGFRENLGN